MDSKEVKQKLLKHDNIEKVLESLECDFITREQGGKLVTAQLPERFGSSNKRSVQVYATEHMPAKIRTIGGFSGDIFSLVSFLRFKSELDELQNTFKESLFFILDIFGWSYQSSSSQRKKDFVAPLKQLASKSKRHAERVPNEPIKESVLTEFKDVADYGWYKEGISLATQEFYQIGYDFLTSRITIPIRNEKGELVGVKGRLLKNSDVDDYNPKYMYIYNCNISQEWFNMYVARESILRKKKAYIFESEKSVMKLHSWGITNALAIASSDISEAQITMLKSLGLDIDIVLCYDNDKTVDEIKKQAKQINNRDVYSILDIEGKTEKKDAPVDQGREVWEYLEHNHTYPVTLRNN